ncbi:ABC transporter ATP-binding protein [Mesorhizobium sp. L-8-3]|uniref:ABC transporter ATP-binding protein n=1 Tax=Mesorhizobium sp. L-8-3 TaxID=2744522 RepID=UPI0019291034|nr:ATP-binding cassette domain-containing protein [Mesorhizobium sp. L-8-3]BCH25877.1 ABC transporter ATP-binding protein [Mesorhizobium sp. L-8-3]
MPELAPAAAWKNVTARYPYAGRDAVGPVDLDVRQGERLLLLGPSGSGKSTLLNTLTALIPQTIPATVAGSIRLFGSAVNECRPDRWAGTVARFFQDADQTLCGMRVEDEIAFALENRAIPEQDIVRKVSEAMRRVGLSEAWRRRRTATLSGGEKQLVALAATLVQEAPLFVADEPTAHLAPAAAARLHHLLLEESIARSVLIVDHRLDGLIGSVDRVAVLGVDGEIIAEGQPAPLFRRNQDLFDRLGIWVPTASRLDAKLAEAGLAPATPPLTIDGLLRAIDAEGMTARAAPVLQNFLAEHSARASLTPGAEIAARLEKADCAPLFGPTILRNISLEIRTGECLGILGANGAGKSTLGASLAGLLRLGSGRRQGAIGGVAFQYPESQFTAGSVREEIVASLDRSLPISERLRTAEDIAAAWNLADLAERHPYELSQGQKRRLALATLTATERWRLLVLDEPTAGLDAAGATMIAGRIEALARSGRGIAVITHDMDFALRLCARSVIVGEGGLLAEGPTVELLEDRNLVARAGLAEPVIAPVRRWLRQVPAC